MNRLLCVFAHPDDECYGPGGTIARCALDGADVFVTTFTAGEAGSIGVSKTLPRAETIRCHETQYEFFVSLHERFEYRAMANPEHFARGPSRLRFDGGPVTDIFEGIRDH